MFGLGAGELIVVLVIVLVLFGSAKLPKLARSLGQAQREFKTGLTEGERDERDERDEREEEDARTDKPER